MTLVLGGVITFLVVRLMLSMFGITRGDRASVGLMVVGIMQLGAFVARPYGGDLLAVTGKSSSLTLVIGLFAIVVAVAALLPGFAASIIGVALLAANVAAISLEGSCFDDARTVTLAALGFGGAWLASSALWRRGR